MKEAISECRRLRCSAIVMGLKAKEIKDVLRLHRLTLFLIIISSLSQTTVGASTRSVVSNRNQRNQMPTVQQIVERFLHVLGGRAAWLKIKSQYVAGTMEMSALGLGNFEAYTKSPGHSLIVMRFPAGEFRAGFDGKRSWTQAGQNPAAYNPPEKQQPNNPESDFYKYLNFNKHYPNAKVIGIEEVEGSKAYVVEATWVGGKHSQKFFFNIRTGFLVLRDDSRIGDDGKKIVDMMYYSDYREVDRIKLACSLRMIQGDMTILTKYTEVKNNITMDDAIFKLPGSK